MVRIPNLPTATNVSGDDFVPIYDNTGDLTGRATLTAVVAAGGGVPGTGDMILSAAQTVTGAKQFNPGTFLDKGNWVYNVKAFLAVGDGTTDDTTAIQQAINAAHAVAGGTVFFPAGTYKITSELTVYSDIVLQGVSMETSLIKQTTLNANGLHGTAVSSFCIRDLGIIGNGSGSTAGTGTGIGIFLEYGGAGNNPFHNFRKVMVRNWGSDGLKIQTAIVSTFDGIYSAYNGGHGFNWYEGGTSCAFTGCWARQNAQAGYRFYQSVYQNLSGCAADNNGVGYWVESAQSIGFFSCGSEGSLKNGGSYDGYNWYVKNSSIISLYTCWVTDNRNLGVWATSSTQVLSLNIADNTPNGTATNFIKVDSGCTAAIYGLHNTTANSLAAGTTTIIDDGAGAVRPATDLILPNNRGLYYRNAADAADKLVLSIDTSDNTILKSATTGIYFQNSSGTNIARILDASNTLDMMSHQVSNVTNPTHAQDAATKNYVDSHWQIYNIEEYGAVGDGVTDAFAAFQAAITAAQNAGGGTVFIPAGTFVISGLPQITGSNITVQGTGSASKLLLAPASLNAAGTTMGIWVNGGNNVLIEKLYIDGNFANIAKNGTYQATNTLWAPTLAKYGAQSVKNYIYAGTGVDSSTYLTFRCPIRITDASDVTVQNCTIKNSISAGILVDGTAVDLAQNILIRNNRLSYIWDNAIYFHKGVRYGSAIGNHCSDTQYAGITAIYCNDILIANNIIHDTGPSQSDSAGVEVCGVNVASITGNIIYNCLFVGVEMKTTNETNITGGASSKYVRNSNVQVHGNYIHDCNHPGFPSNNANGVNFFGTDNTTVSGNKIERCDAGISLGSLCADPVIKGNTIRSNKGVGISVGNSADVFNAEIDGNTIEYNGSDGVSSYAPVRIVNNIIRNNGAEAINLLAPPAGLPYKIDYIFGNLIADNTNNGVRAAAGAGNPAIIRNNLFQNSDTRTFTDGVTVVGTTLTSATATFATTDVGSTIILMATGDASGGATLTTTIAAFTNSTTITLAAAASVARSGVTFQLYRPKNVFYDGVMASGNPQLTSATANFTSADVGKSVVIYSTDGPNPSVLGTYTVSSFTDAQHVNLSASPTNRSNILFVIKRSLGKQQRGVFVTNSSDIEFVKNRTYSMRTENYNSGSISASSFISDNYDFGSVVNSIPAILSVYRPISNKTSSNVFPSQTKDEVFTCNATSNAITVFLPNTADVGAGRVYIVKKTDASANTVTVATGNSQTIDGSTTQVISVQYDLLRIICDGSNWQVI